MEVQVLSKNLIKPSAPTPSDLRKFKLSFMDQLALAVYVDLFFYYPEVQSIQRRNQMVKSLSDVLTIFYPLAGRYTKGNLYVECNDEGVAYSEAQVNVELDSVMYGKIKMEMLKNFAPSDTGEIDEATSPLVAIQVNSFSCGGLLVCIKNSHRIADGTTMFAFANAWATACRKGIDQVVRPNFNLASHIPARVSLRPEQPPTFRKHTNTLTTKRLMFDGEAISRLKAQVGWQASRVEVVTALIWRALISVVRTNHGHLKTFSLEHAVNLRDRTIPPIPRNTFGNFITLAVPRVILENDEDHSKMELQDLVKLIHNAIQNNLNKQLHSEEFFTMVSDTFREIDVDLNPNEVDHRIFTSWCSFPMYEVDFGWGKPSWVTKNMPDFELTVLMNTKDGDGLEVWVSLYEQNMLQFQENLDIKNFMVSY